MPSAFLSHKKGVITFGSFFILSPPLFPPKPAFLGWRCVRSSVPKKKKHQLIEDFTSRVYLLFRKVIRRSENKRNVLPLALDRYAEDFYLLFIFNRGGRGWYIRIGAYSPGSSNIFNWTISILSRTVLISEALTLNFNSKLPNGIQIFCNKILLVITKVKKRF